MAKEYTKEEFWKLYKKLPEELQEAIFSVETADHIWDICERNDVKKVRSIAKYVGNVLIGVLTPEDFQETLEKELTITKDIAKKVTQEINRFIFYPVRPALEQLYRVETASLGESLLTKPLIKTSENQQQKEELKEEAPPTPSGSDTYRESIE